MKEYCAGVRKGNRGDCNSNGKISLFIVPEQVYGREKITERSVGDEQRGISIRQGKGCVDQILHSKCWLKIHQEGKNSAAFMYLEKVYDQVDREWL